MILFTFGTDVRSDSPPHATRWAFEVGHYGWRSPNGGAFAGLSWQYKSKPGDPWHTARAGYYHARLSLFPAVGRVHGYYDGPHDRLSLGWLHLDWSGDWCERCFSGEP